MDFQIPRGRRYQSTCFYCFFREEGLIDVDGTKLKLSGKVLKHADELRKKTMTLKVSKELLKSAKRKRWTVNKKLIASSHVILLTYVINTWSEAFILHQAVISHVVSSCHISGPEPANTAIISRVKRTNRQNVAERILWSFSPHFWKRWTQKLVMVICSYLVITTRFPGSQ